MAKAKPGVTVSVTAKTPINYSGELYGVGDQIEVDESHLQQLLDVDAVDVVVPADPEKNTEQ